MVRNPPANSGDLDPWVRKIPWRRKWQPTPVSVPGKSHGQRSLVGTVHGAAKSRTPLNVHTHTHTHTQVNIQIWNHKHFCAIDRPQSQRREEGVGVGGAGFWTQDLEFRAGGQLQAWPRVPARGERRRLCFQTRLLGGWVGPTGTADLTPNVSFMPVTTDQRQGWGGPGG